MRYQLQDETGTVLHESDDPTDLLGAGEALIGGGAAPLFVIVDTEFGLDDDDDGQPDEAREWADYDPAC